MFLPVGIGNASRHLPDHGAGAIKNPRAGIDGANVALAVRSVDHVADVARRPGELPAHERHDPLPGILVVDAHAVPHLTVIRAGESSSHPEGRHGIAPHDPVHGVEVVDGLFGDLIAAQPDEVHPVGELVFRVAHSFGPWPIPDAPRAVAGLRPDHVADRTLTDVFDGAEVVDLPPVLRARHDRGAPGDCRVVNFQTRSVAGGIDARGLLGKDMLAGLDRGPEIDRPEARRGGDQHDIDVRVVEHPLVAIQPVVHRAIIEGDLPRMGLLHRLPHRRALRGIEIGRRHEFHALVDRERVVDRPASPAAAAHDGEPQFPHLLIGNQGGVHHHCRRRRSQRRRRRSQRRRHERPPRDGGGRHHDCVTA